MSGVILFILCVALVVCYLKKRQVDMTLGVKSKRWKVEWCGVDRIREDRSGLSLSLLSMDSHDD